MHVGDIETRAFGIEHLKGSLFLDEARTYSCGLFSRGGPRLAAAEGW